MNAASGRGPGRDQPERHEGPRQMRPLNMFVNNYCEDFENLKIEEDIQRNAVGCPAGFRSDEALSRQLTYVLRHAAGSEGFRMHPGGQDQGEQCSFISINLSIYIYIYIYAFIYPHLHIYIKTEE